MTSAAHRSGDLTEGKRRNSKESDMHAQVTEDIHSITPGDVEPALPWSYYFTPRYLGSALGVVLLANCTFISYVMPVSLLTVINADIGPSPNITLLSLIHTLIKGITFLLIGRFSDIFGRRWFIIGGQTVCCVGSVISALATNVDTLIGGTVIIALGGAVQPLYPLFVQEIVPNKFRGLSQSLITLSCLPTIGFSPAIGRALVQHTTLGWRWTYWINLVLCAVSVVLFFFCYHPPKFEHINSGKTKLKQFLEIDFFGLFLYVGGLVPLLLGFVWSTQAAGWNTPSVYGPLAAGVAALIAFALWETLGNPKAPIIPLYLLKSREFVAAVVVGVVGQMAYYAFNLLWPQQINSLFPASNITIGLMASTTGAAMAFGEIVTGPFFHSIGRARLQMIISAAMLTLFCGLMAYTNENRKVFAIVNTALAGLFIGWVELVAMVVVGLVTPPKDIGVGQGFFASCRNVFGTLATSIFVAIRGARINANIKAVPPAVVAAGLPQSSIPTLMKAIATGTAKAIQAVPGMTPAIAKVLSASVRHAYSESYRTVYLSSIAFGAIALIAAFFTSDVDKHMTNFMNKRIDTNILSPDEMNEKEVA